MSGMTPEQRKLCALFVCSSSRRIVSTFDCCTLHILLSAAEYPWHQQHTGQNFREVVKGIQAETSHGASCRADREFQKTNEKPPIIIVPAAATACLNQLNARVSKPAVTHTPAGRVHSVTPQSTLYGAHMCMM